MDLSRGLIGAMGGAAQGYAAGVQAETAGATEAYKEQVQELRAENLARFTSGLNEAATARGEIRKKGLEDIAFDPVTGKTVTSAEYNAMSPEEQAKYKTMVKAGMEATAQKNANEERHLTSEERRAAATEKNADTMEMWRLRGGVGGGKSGSYEDRQITAKTAAVGKLLDSGTTIINQQAASTSASPVVSDIASTLMEKSIIDFTEKEGGDPRAASGKQLGSKAFMEAQRIYDSANKDATAAADTLKSKAGFFQSEKDIYGGSKLDWIEKETAKRAYAKVNGVQNDGPPPTSAILSPLATKDVAPPVTAKPAPQSKSASKGIINNILNSSSPSTDLGKVLGGATKAAVGAVKVVPSIENFVNQATAKTLYAIAPENVVKELMKQSQAFGDWWSKADTETRNTFINQVAAEQRKGTGNANPADKYFK